MKKQKRTFIIAFACLLLFAMMSFVACSSNSSDSNDDTVEAGETKEYSVKIETAGGMAMSEIDVYVYDNDSLENMQDFAKTDEEGQVSFVLPENDSYAIVLSGVTKGYAVNDSYSFDGENTTIVLSTSLVTDDDISTATLGVGDVMYDFTVTTSDNEELKLSDVLKEKKLVVLNFWYTTCSWCLKEFPIMDEVYKSYSEDVEIIALNPMEDAKAIESFLTSQDLSFKFAACPSSWANTFGVSGYPTSVFIDQHGVICAVESGAITSKRPFICAFDKFTADDYEQTLCLNGINELVTQIKPTYEMPSSEDIAGWINGSDLDVIYHAEEDDEAAEYIWPFIQAEKLGETCIKPSNAGIDDSYAILYANVSLKKGQALGFDYLASTEKGCDILYVIVNDDDVFTISGVSEEEEWKSCYPCVAEEDGEYEVALCFMKDSDGAEGDDTVYVDNMRIVDASSIDVATYLPRYAAVEQEDGTFSYADIVLNENDGYYHVGSANGPYLLADLMGYTAFNEESSIYDIVYAGDADKDGVSLYDAKADGGLGMVSYFSYASNASINGLCTVTEELAEHLKQVGEVAGFEDDANEWLKICKYYQAYGTNNVQLSDPIKGLDTFCAYKTVLGKDVDTNYFYYDRAIVPRGLLSEFVPTKSGVYRFTSKSDYQDGIDGWIFNEAREIIYTYEHSERMFDDNNNCSIVYYMEAGTPYYINMAFWDIYEAGFIYYDVEYLGSSYDLFRTCSPGYFTYDSDATGSAMYDVIAGGITAELKDGKYYESEGGSLIYCDFQGSTGIFDMSMLDMIELGGFDFTKSETDGEILAYLKQNDNDADKTIEYLKELWGEDYDTYAEIYLVDEVLAGKFHGEGEDLTEEIKTYISKMDKSGNKEREGCVVVDERLAELLQMLMDKYTFDNVEDSWIKLCYYYDYLGR